MIISKLYIKDFFCYDRAYIDFTQFSSALIVGKKENDDNISNGVGKTTIFKAIEYCLFNHSDTTLENIIRDEQSQCSITLDFIVNDQLYRLTRTRTIKGITDLTLYQRTPAEGSDEEVFHSLKNDQEIPLHNPIFWQDISGRRSADTEKEVNKLIKINIKSFRIFVHFMQTDYSGLTTATPEKRKILLRDALNLIVYSKLEKVAKDKLNLFNKEVDKLSLMIETLANPDADMITLSNKLLNNEQEIKSKQTKLLELENSQQEIIQQVNKLTNNHSSLTSKFSELLVKEQALKSEKLKIETSVKEYTTKKTNIINAAKDIMVEIKALEETESQLQDLDFAKTTILSDNIISNKEKVAQLSLTIQNDMSRCEKLKRPIPVDGECEACHQLITNEHRTLCQQQMTQELKERQLNVQNCKKEIAALNNQNQINQQEVNRLTLAKQHLESIKIKLINKKQETKDKRALHDEYKGNLDKFISEATNKTEQLQQIAEELKNSSLEEANLLQNQINKEKDKVAILNKELLTLNKELTHFNAGRAVLQHDLIKRQEDQKKKVDYTKLLQSFNDKIVMYPSVIQAFSSTGIPNLIIQNVLDDLQIEANNLLLQLKPEVQLSFLIEKTKTDGEEADTLDINYSINGKKRYYEVLSGAQKLAVTFALKLGLSFILQKLSGVNIRFLLLDEIDQSLDKAATDQYANIIRAMQKDFTVLVITHNDRLKDKFNSAILVEQDVEMISRAKVVSTW